MRLVQACSRWLAPCVVIISGLALAGALRAEEALRWKFEVGEKLDYDMDQNMTLTMAGGPLGKVSSTVKQQMEMTWTVEQVADDGEAVIRQKIERVRMSMGGPVSFEYDSDADEAPTGMAAMVAPMFDAMTKEAFEMTITPRGEIKDIKIPEEVLTSLKNSPGAQQMGEVATADGFKKMLTQGAFALPAEKVEKGDSWTSTIEVNNPMAGKQSVETKYTYEGTKEVDGKSLAVFKPELKMQFEGNENLKMTVKDQQSDGEVLFDVENGRLSSSELHQNVTMEVSVAGQTMEQQIEQTINISVRPASEPSTSTDSSSSSSPESSDQGTASEGESAR